MADEQTPPTDTPTSQSDAPAADAPAPEGKPEQEAPAGDDAPADEGTVLGGKEGEDGNDGSVKSDEPTGAPEKYELALEGVTLDAEMVAEAEPILRELNLSNDDANKLLPMAAKLVDKTQANTLQMLADAGAQQKKDWLDAFKADPEIGGPKREETEHLAAKGLDALGYVDGHPFRRALTESGFGNHPDMIRAFRRVGELVGEDGNFVQPDGAARNEVPTEKRWYGKQGAE
jgi:hypothetical protein